MDDNKQSKNLEQLLAKCDFNAPISDDVKEWLELEPVGRERLESYQPNQNEAWDKQKKLIL